jgi:hypothetical protein
MACLPSSSHSDILCMLSIGRCIIESVITMTGPAQVRCMSYSTVQPATLHSTCAGAARICKALANVILCLRHP